MEFLIKILTMYGENKTRLVNALTALRPETKVTTSHIYNWIERDQKVPADWVLALSECAEWKITPHQLRPDLYPHKDDGLPVTMRCDCEKAA
jgi:DNA-binding transcriptional regulator YdaS (Cro superfamily)